VKPVVLLLLQVAHTPALHVSATMRTTGAGREMVETMWRENTDDDVDDDKEEEEEEEEDA
jgi:hypothetical protein